MRKRIMATFQPQAWRNDRAVDIDGRREFDITDEVLRLGREKALATKDNSWESDNLAREAGLLSEHSGPFYVRCEDAIREYFGL